MEQHSITISLEDMNQCSNSVTSVLGSMQTAFENNQSLATALAEIYVRNAEPEYWPGVECRMTQKNFAEAYVQVATEINEVVRASASMVCVPTIVVTIEFKKYIISETKLLKNINY